MTDTINPSWFDHPIVRRSARQLPPGSSVLDLLEATHATMTELEDRFPGMPFAEILSGSDVPHPTTVAATLLERGARPSDVRLICKSESDKPMDMPSEDDFQLAGTKLSELVKLGYPKVKGRMISRMRENVSVSERHWAQAILDRGLTQSKAAKHFAVNRHGIRIALGKVMYRRWCGVSDHYRFED